MKKDGLYEKVKKGLKRNLPKYDDELEELEKENLLCGSKENTQRNKLTMKEKNTLEDLLTEDELNQMNQEYFSLIKETEQNHY